MSLHRSKIYDVIIYTSPSHITIHQVFISICTLTIMKKKGFDSFGLTTEELKILKSLNTPRKIQDFLDDLKINFEENGKDTCQSPRQVLKSKKAHCIEAAIFAAATLYLNGFKPLIMDFETIPKDEDHVVALFKQNNCWGAISKTNHSILRYRDPIYKTPRELAMSYFHEYFLFSNGKKTMRAFSSPINLKIFNKNNWMSTNKEVWFIPEYLTNVKHNNILTKKQIKSLRPADKITIKAAMLTDFKDPLKRKLP